MSLHAGVEQLSKSRIITAGGSITEIVYALGAQDQLVAVDTSSLYPSDAIALPKVGYYRQLNTEGVLSMNPTHVIAVSGAGPQSVLTQIESTGVDMTLLEQPKTVKGIQSLISSVATLVDKETEAKVLNNKIEQQLASLTSVRHSNKEKVVFLMSVGDRGLMVAGDNTMPQLIMELLNIDNPYGDLEGFKPISIESLLSVDPNVILMPEHQVNGRTKEALCQTNELKFWASRHGCQLFFVDSLSFLGLTPRLPEALAKTLAILENIES
jgi:iron complex transport system substrate-binding protein